MSRLASLIALLALVTPATAQAARADGHYAKTLHSDTHMRHWTTPQRVPATASVQVRVYYRGHALKPIDAGDLRVVFVGPNDQLVKVTARSGDASLSVSYVSGRPARLRFVYWWV